MPNIISSTDVLYPLTAETERLIVRTLKMSDAPFIEGFMADPIATEFFPMYEPSEAAKNTKDMLERQLERYELGQYGLQALIEKKSGTYVGHCGLLIQEIDGKSELEIGYSLLRSHWRKGYATEAAQFFREFAFKHRLAKSIISIIHHENIASQAVALRNGMKLSERSQWRGLPVTVFRINIPNFGL